MFLCCWLVLVALTHISSSTNPGAQVKLTEKGLEYARQIGMARIQQELQRISIPDISGTQQVSRVGKVQYSLSNMQIVNVALPQSLVTLVPNVGVRLNIPGAFVSMVGNWWVRYLRVIKASGSFTLSIYALNIQTNVAITSDDTGRPVVNSVNCAASVGRVGIKFYGGASWLYNLFHKFVEHAIRRALEARICPSMGTAVSGLNPQLQKLNVIAKVDKFAEIDYSMVSAPSISSSAITLNLKGQFYNIGKRQEPPFSPAAFSLPPQRDNMLYMGISPFTGNSAGFVYNTAGALSINITADMIPKDFPLPLTTESLGIFIPKRFKQEVLLQVAELHPNLNVQLRVENEKWPNIIYNNNVMVKTTVTMTAYAVQNNGGLSPLFVLNVNASASVNLSISGMKLVANFILDKMTFSLNTSYIGNIRVHSFAGTLQQMLSLVAIPKINEKLKWVCPLPTLGKVALLNTQLRVLKDYVLIGTDVAFDG
ncbi:bactericidal permeability-increasing protein-like [Synchiropus splendidus]|uniref:bactericidal permeability-increasing protein-like n=1 Tax=Synchiropus splendidus TaxID=270530 RepID=UPI00237E6C84|nr:bactericidal permeability-increasing protein-like [Synchiropus splendidus]